MKIICPACHAPVVLVVQAEQVMAVEFAPYHSAPLYTLQQTFYRCDECGRRWDSLDAATLPEPQQEN